MGKVQDLEAGIGGFADDSMGLGSAAAPAQGVPTLPANLKGTKKDRDTLSIDIGRIVPDPDQPRKKFDPVSIEQLAESLRTRGLLQPIRVRWDQAIERYVVLAGERRFRAAIIAELPSLACVVHPGPLSESERYEIQLIENCLRENLKPMEQARAFASLKERHGCLASEVARMLSVSESAVCRSLKLLDLEPSIQDSVDSGKIPPSVAYELSKVPDAEKQVQLATEVIDGKLKRDEIAPKSNRPRESRGGASRTKPWTFEGAGKRVKITVQVSADDVTEEEIAATLRDAVNARRKLAKSRAAAS